jgi:pyruvate dehydrogenase E1 component alpha subunit/2-oxoisovalerate dehydrogenase E1 component alpha subunit
LNQAAVEKLPLVLVVANNQYAYSTPTSSQFACEDLVDRALGYGVMGHSVDATNLEACLATLKLAIGQARAGGGPQLVVGTLLRLCGHGEHDDAAYITNALKTSALGCDCLKLAEDRIQAENFASAAEVLGWRAQAIQEVEEAIAIAQHDPQPDPYAERWQALSTKHLIDFQSEA